jgi:hypothetical protein
VVVTVRLVGVPSGTTLYKAPLNVSEVVVPMMLDVANNRSAVSPGMPRGDVAVLVTGDWAFSIESELDAEGGGAQMVPRQPYLHIWNTDCVHELDR